jgi:hypothetical protein
MMMIPLCMQFAYEVPTPQLNPAPRATGVKPPTAPTAKRISFYESTLFILTLCIQFHSLGLTTDFGGIDWPWTLWLARVHSLRS